jgi:hypothetical protein
MLDFAEVQRRVDRRMTHGEIISPLVDTLIDPEQFDGVGGTTLLTQHECVQLAAMLNSQAMMLDDVDHEPAPEIDRRTARLILILVTTVLWLSAALVARL